MESDSLVIKYNPPNKLYIKAPHMARPRENPSIPTNSITALCSPTMANTSNVLARDESSDYDSSCSSTTVPETGRSWLSNLSFSSRRTSSVSVSSSATETASLGGSNKPHKANQVAWEAMKRLKSTRGGRVGLDHFRLLRRLGSGDIGNVYLCQIRYIYIYMYIYVSHLRIDTALP